jgi:hypothetical protein
VGRGQWAVGSAERLSQRRGDAEEGIESSRQGAGGGGLTQRHKSEKKVTANYANVREWREGTGVRRAASRERERPDRPGARSHRAACGVLLAWAAAARRFVVEVAIVETCVPGTAAANVRHYVMRPEERCSHSSRKIPPRNAPLPSVDAEPERYAGSRLLIVLENCEDPLLHIPQPFGLERRLARLEQEP